MNRVNERAEAVRFTPHGTDVLRLRRFLPSAAGALCAFVWLMQGRDLPAGAYLLYTAASLLALTLVLLPAAEIRRRHTSCEMDGGCLTFRSPTGEKKLRLDCVVRVEIRRSAIRRLFGCAELNIYSDTTHRVWASVVLPEQTAESVMKAAVFPGKETGRIIPGRHSAAVCALTSGRATLLLMFSGWFTLLSRESRLMNVAAFLLLAAALFDMLHTGIRWGHISFVRMQEGCRVTAGLFGGRDIYIPERAITGAVFRQSPLGVLCGFGSMVLLTSDGGEIPVACRVREDGAVYDALRLIRAEGKAGRDLSQPDELRRKNIVSLVVSLFAAFLAGMAALRSDDPLIRTVLCGSAGACTVAALRSLVGMSCAGSLGLRVSPSAVYFGGMSGCSAVRIFLLLRQIAGVRVKSGLFMRMNGLCSAQPYAKGKGKGTPCSCVSYGALNGLVSRFC